MRVLTWNINGIRSQTMPVKQMLEELNADIICVQETKISRDMLDTATAIVDGYTSYYSFCKTRTGYSGVSTYCKDSVMPSNACEGLTYTQESSRKSVLNSIGKDDMLSVFTEDELQSLDCEGRAVLTEHLLSYGDTCKSLVIINVYCPRVDPDKPERKIYQKNFHKLVGIKADVLIKSGRHVIITGDLNVSHRRIDHCKPEENPNFESRPSRLWLNALLTDVHHPDTQCDGNQGQCRCQGQGQRTESKMEDTSPNVESTAKYVDIFRYYFPSRKDAYTCWNTVTGARDLNFGTRIDYVICDLDLPTSGCDILPQVTGSDHCPVYADVSASCIAAEKAPDTCTKYFPELAGKQCKLLDYFNKKSTTAVTAETSIESFRQDTNTISHDDLFSNFHQESQHSMIERKSEKRSLTSAKASAAKKVKITKPSSSGRGQGQGALFRAFGLNRSTSLPTNSDSVTENHQEDVVSTGASVLKVVSQPIPAQQLEEELFKDQLDSHQPATSKSTVSNSWSSLFNAPKKPVCKGHNEKCALRTVKKDGPNKGKQFWVCARSEGPKSNPESRCDYFEWVKKGK